MLGVIGAMLLASQPQANTPPGAPLRSDDPPSRELSAAHDLFYEDERRLPTREGRIAIHEYGRCAADRSPDRATRVLRQDFTTATYRNQLRQVSRANEGCFGRRGRMYANNLLFAGAMAEHLLERGEEPLNVRLARAAQGPATQAFGPGDRVALCVVRSVPDQAAALFASEPASPEEESTTQALQPVVRLCGRGAGELRASAAGLRAILATAAFRVVHGASGSAGN